MRERVFEKDGHEVTTETPTAAVDLIARGYREVLDEPYEQGGVLPRSNQTVVIPKGTTVTTPATRPPNDERNHAPD